MRRIFSCLMVGFLLVSLFSVNVFAYTVDDIRDLVGKERVDDRFTQEEMDMVIQQYESIERENMMLKMFAIGKEIDLDSGLIAEYDALEDEFVIIQAMIDARKRSGLTQKQLAERTGIAQADISKLENGNANPSLKTLRRLAAGMGMKIKLEFSPANI